MPHITGNQMRAARALMNWSQSDLADKAGLWHPTIANIETGKTFGELITSMKEVLKNLETASLSPEEEEKLEKYKKKEKAKQCIKQQMK